MPFRKLLGPVPKTPTLPGEMPPGPIPAGRPQQQTANTEQQQTDEEGNPIEGGDADRHASDMQTDEQQQQQEVPVVDKFAGQLLHEVRAKASWGAVLEWLDSHSVQEEVGEGPQGCLQVGIHESGVIQTE